MATAFDIVRRQQSWGDVGSSFGTAMHEEPMTQANLCVPGWAGSGPDGRTAMAGNQPSEITCMLPYIGEQRVIYDRSLFDWSAPHTEEQMPVQLAQKLSGPSYFQQELPNGVIIPMTGNVPLIKQLDVYKTCYVDKNVMDPVIQTFGPAIGVDRRSLLTSLVGVPQTGPMSLLSSAELRGYNPNSTYLMTFNPDLTLPMGAPPSQFAKYPMYQPFA